MISKAPILFNSKLSQTITLEDFYNLLIALEQLYVMNGYFLTRFIVPAQTIEQNGKIRVIVFPGKIESNDYSRLDKRSLRPIKKYFDTVIGVTGIDYAVMEKTDKGVVLPMDVGWSDVGDWQSMWKNSQKDKLCHIAYGGFI